MNLLNTIAVVFAFNPTGTKAIIVYVVVIVALVLIGVFARGNAGRNRL